MGLGYRVNSVSILKIIVHVNIATFANIGGAADVAVVVLFVG